MILGPSLSEIPLWYEDTIARESPLFLSYTGDDSIEQYRCSGDEDFDAIGIVSIDTHSGEIVHTELESASDIRLIHDEYTLPIDSLECPIGNTDINSWSHRLDHDLIGTDLEIGRKNNNIHREEY